MTAFTARQLRVRAIQLRDGNPYYEETAAMLDQGAMALDRIYHFGHVCTVTSWRRIYRWPVLWLLHFATGTTGFRCKTCGAEVRWRP